MPGRPNWEAPGISRPERLIRWIEGLNVTSGALAGQPLVMRQWQREILHELYATGPDGRRIVRTGVISMGRKNGKTGLAGALALAHLCGPEAVPRGQVLSAAADRGQASLVYSELRAFALEQPQLRDRLVFRDFNRTVEDVKTGSVFAALSADARKAHGLSPTFAIADEVAQWRGRDLFDALATGAGAHAESLLLAISTRSPDTNNPLEELLRYGEGVADGTIPDPTFRSFVWTAPLDADPWAEETWAAANPALGDFRSLEDVRSQAMQARRVPSKEASFRAFTLNQPVAPDDRFIHANDWDACSGDAEARGPCYGALDLSSGAADLTALALFWPETGKLTVRAFLPDADLDRKMQEDRAPYREWINRGLVVPMPGRAIDRPWLVTWIARETEGLELAAVGHDRWGLKDLQAVMEREGVTLPLKEHGQGFKDMSPSINAFEAAVLKEELCHGGNALLRWAVSNAVVDTDPAGNRKLTKARAHGRIDPLIASVMAMGLASREPPAPSFEFTGLVLG
ncbi:terminase large subunit [Rhodovarius lipocyclicus]|uniref:terminase large subunit n=1 Tax=Rhodovarius lipocyclicus TaxID=268410 RepID=UPI001916EB70|nr:terminase TerL endonuclease subunit [Rhodovarius lipocyclicus]